MRLQLERAAHPECCRHGLEDPHHATGQGEEEDHQAQKYSLPHEAELDGAAVFVFGVGVLVIELRHHPGPSHGEPEETDGYCEAPNTAENERPANGLYAIQVGNHHLLLLSGGGGGGVVPVTAHFVTHGGQERLDQEGAQQEATTDEKVKGIDEGSAFLWAQSEH